MGFWDPNELFAYLRACQNVDHLRQVSQVADQRVSDLLAVRAGQAPAAVKRAVVGNRGQVAEVASEWVQPTDEGHPVTATSPMGGPAIEALTGQIGPGRGVQNPPERRPATQGTRQASRQAVGQEPKTLHEQVMQMQAEREQAGQQQAAEQPAAQVAKTASRERGAEPVAPQATAKAVDRPARGQK